MLHVLRPVPDRAIPCSAASRFVSRNISCFLMVPYIELTHQRSSLMDALIDVRSAPLYHLGKMIDVNPEV